MQEGKVENSSSDTEVDDPVENLATGSLKIREADRAWLEGEQVKLRAKGGKKITQAEMFTRMRAAYELWLAAPPGIPTVSPARPSETHSTGLELNQINSLTAELASLRSQIVVFQAQNSELLRILKGMTPRYGKASPDRAGNSKDAKAEIQRIEDGFEREFARTRAGRKSAEEARNRKAQATERAKKPGKRIPRTDVRDG